MEQARFNMIEQQIRQQDVLDGHVLQLLAVKREDFVPAAHRALAFEHGNSAAVGMHADAACQARMAGPGRSQALQRARIGGLRHMYLGA